MNKRAFRYLLILLVTAFTIWSLRQTGFDLETIYRGIFRERSSASSSPGSGHSTGISSKKSCTRPWSLSRSHGSATLLAAMLSLPLSFLAARNITPATAVGSAVRFFFNVDRSIDVLIVALVLVSAVGLGPLAGTIAIAVHSIGSMGKLFTEAIEAIERGPVEALESVGATRLQIVRWSVIPQVIPYLISFTLYRLELNIRSAVVCSGSSAPEGSGSC